VSVFLGALVGQPHSAKLRTTIIVGEQYAKLRSLASDSAAEACLATNLTTRLSTLATGVIRSFILVSSDLFFSASKMGNSRHKNPGSFV
jgi:hypothetical protein